MREIVTLSITSFRFAIGGEHYYGSFNVRTKATRERQPDGSIRKFTRMGHGSISHPSDGHELTRTIGAKEALYLNKKDNESFFGGGGFRLKSGDAVKRFNDRESIVEAAIASFPDLFDETDVLLHKPNPNDDDEVVVLVAPDEVRAAIEGRPYDQRMRWLRENGYTVHPLAEDGMVAPEAP
jgi:hypothetical protein